MLLRKFLKSALKFLANWALKKHHIEIVVVAGWYGTEITRELVYNILGTKFNVRRIVKNPWWDFSIPLSILGYRDEKRAVISWLFLIIKSFFRLLFGKANPHILVLNMNYSEPETTKFWSSMIKPAVLLVTSFKEEIEILEKIIKNTMQAKGSIVYHNEDASGIKPILSGYKKVLSFGRSGNADIKYEKIENNSLVFKYSGQHYSIQKSFLPGVKPEMLAGSLGVGILKKVELLDALYAMVKCSMPPKLLAKIKLDLLQ